MRSLIYSSFKYHASNNSNEEEVCMCTHHPQDTFFTAYAKGQSNENTGLRSLCQMKRWKITGKRTPTAIKKQAKLELHPILRWNTQPQAFTGTTKKVSRIHIKECHHVTLLWWSCCHTRSSGSLRVGSMGCHCPQGETEKQAGCFLETSPNYHAKAC